MEILPLPSIACYQTFVSTYVYVFWGPCGKVHLLLVAFNDVCTWRINKPLLQDMLHNIIVVATVSLITRALFKPKRTCDYLRRSKNEGTTFGC